MLIVAFTFDFVCCCLQQYLDKTWWPYYPLFGDLAVGRRMRRTAATVETVHRYEIDSMTTMLSCSCCGVRLRKSTQILRRGTKYRLDTYVYHMRSHFFGAARRFITDAARIDAKEVFHVFQSFLFGSEFVDE